jgi:hypothetical protein
VQTKIDMNNVIERISPTLRVGDSFVNKYNETEIVAKIIGNNYIAESAGTYKKKWIEQISIHEIIIYTDAGDIRLLDYDNEEDLTYGLAFLYLQVMMKIVDL